MKMRYLFICLLGFSLLMFSCGGSEDESSSDQTEHHSSDKTPKNEINNLNNLIDQTMDKVQDEMNHQVSDPNSELLEAVDTMKKMMDTVKDVVVDKVEEEMKKQK